MASFVRAGRLKVSSCVFAKILTNSLSANSVSSRRLLLHTSVINNVAGIPINMPSLSPTMSEGTIVKWLKQEGDTVQPGDVICDIQTDKAVVSMELEEEGIIAKILRNEDSKEITVGQVIALMVEPGEDWKAVEVPADLLAPAAPAAGAPATEPPPLQQQATAEFSGVRHMATVPTSVGPAVRTLLELYNIDAAQVAATGPHGKLLKGDILAHVTANRLTPLPPQPVAAPAAAAPAPSAAAPSAPAAAPATVETVSAAGYVDLPLSNMRKTIAKRLTQSKTEIPHAYMQCEAPIDRLLAERKQLKAEGVEASVNDYIIKAVALCLRLHPEVNCVWAGEQAQRLADVDISVAVATEGGLITPVIRRAADRDVGDICAVVKDLAGRARAGKLKPEEYMGGSFSISNLGMMGISEFSAIINPPQCGILAVGGGRAVVAEDGSTETRISCRLSYDARAVPEEVAAAFMETLADLLSAPDLLLKDARRQMLAENL